MPTSPTTKLSRLLSRGGTIAARDIASRGIPRSYLQRALERGEIERVARGVYRPVSAAPTEHHSLVAATRRVPRSAVCLLSALQLHQLTTEIPHEVWLLLDRAARKPNDADLPLRVVRASGPARSHGLERRRIEDVTITVTTPAKTVADCFRYRRHVGLDVALAALRDYLREFPSGVDDLFRAARADRVLPYMRPYIEALV